MSMLKDSWVHEMNRYSLTESFSDSTTPLSNELRAFLRNSVIT